MADLVRVRVGGFEKNVGRAFAESHDLEVLDEPTTNLDGSPRATTRTGGRQVKARTTVDKSAAAKKQAAPAETKKEQGR